MKRPRTSTRLLRPALALICLVAFVSTLRAQQPRPTPTQSDEVVRVTTELVQTDITVFDKNNRFVEGLKPEQFELKVDGRVVPISFFEAVTSGSAEEERQLAAARRGEAARTTTPATPTPTVARGRSLFFFVDDFHLDPESLGRARRAIVRAIETELGPNDQALIAAASGQLGPQQLTSDRAALKAAAERLRPREGAGRSQFNPPMNEFHAVAIARNESDVLEFFIERLLNENSLLGRDGAESEVRQRADTILEQAVAFSHNTFVALDALVRAAAGAPGRKLVFFYSEGFLLENPRTSAHAMLRRVTDMASAAGLVFYTMDARGLAAGMDASVQMPAAGRLSRVALSGPAANESVLNALAVDTGGRALFNNNDLNAGVRRALEETSRYYLIAWRPPRDAGGVAQFRRVEISVVGRPDLKVRARRDLGASVTSALVAGGGASPAAASPADELSKALAAATLERGLPASLVVIYSDAPGASAAAAPSFAVTASMQIPSAALTFESADGGKQAATLDVVGAVLNRQGAQVASFSKRVRIDSDSNAIDPARKLVFYNYSTNLPPGDYRVRMVARDVKTGRIGADERSVEIPDLAAGKLALSSLMLVEQVYADDDEDAGAKSGVQRGVARRFARGARLRFLTYVYNAARGAAPDDAPDLDVTVLILSDGKTAAVPEVRDVLIGDAGKAKGYPFAAEFPLADLSPGEYTLKVTIRDKATRDTATRQTDFVVE